MRIASFAAGSFLLVVIAGCGSSSGGWQTVTKVTADGTKQGFIDNAAVSRPAQIELSVDSRPSIAIRATYSFLCGDVTADPTSTDAGPAETPAQITLGQPPGPPSGCRVNILIDKSAPANLTAILRIRALPAKQ
jgi:hypothetical protein